MNKLIYILGASHTGTTALGLILANDQYSFALGEVYDIFMRRKSPAPATIDWQEAYPGNELEFFKYLLNRYEAITDSSKVIPWVQKMSKQLCSECDIKYVITYKHPLYAYHSFWLRGYNFDQFERMYNSYYKKASKAFDNLIWINWEDFLHNPQSATKYLCNEVGIEYHSKRHEFWTAPYNHFKGASKVRKLHKLETSIPLSPRFPIQDAMEKVLATNWIPLPYYA